MKSETKILKYGLQVYGNLNNFYLGKQKFV